MSRGERAPRGGSGASKPKHPGRMVLVFQGGGARRLGGPQRRDLGRRTEEAPFASWLNRQVRHKLSGKRTGPTGVCL